MFPTDMLLVIFFASFSTCADILGIIPTPSFSHQVVFFDLWKELSLRGHKVTVITSDPQRNESLTNLTEIDMKWTYKFLRDLNSDVKTLNMWNFHTWWDHITRSISQGHLNHHQVQDLIHNKKHFDIILVEALYPELLGFAEIYNCPAILVSSLDVFSNIHYKMGNPAHPALSPILISKFYPPLNFQERIINTIYTLYSTWFNKYVVYPDRSKSIEHFFNITSSVHDLLNKVDMIFINVNPVIHSVRAFGPSTIDISGLRRISAKPLPADLKQFLDSATNGFVYFSLGSNINSKDLAEKSLSSIVESLGELPYKVLWKFEAEAEIIQNKPNNVKMIKWAPQLDILAHPNIRVFVTQGGLQSMEETIHFEVPCVVIPFFADQEQNARLMKNKGFARVVKGYPYIEKEELNTAILEVLGNPVYKNVVKELKRLAADIPMTGMEKAIWWTEYVIRNKGAKQLRNPAADLPLYQYYLLDVVGFLLIMAVITLFVFFIVLKKLYGVFTMILLDRSVLSAKKLQ